MPFEPATLVAGPVIMIIAYAVFGISGFGSALVSIPLLAHFLPLRTVVPVILLLDFSAAIYAGWHFRREVDIKEVRSMVVGIVAGALLGVALLAYAPGDRLLLPPPEGRVASLAERLDLPDWAAAQGLQLAQAPISLEMARQGQVWCLNALRGVWPALLS